VTKLKAEWKKRAYESWLRTPEGLAWQEKESQKRRKQKEESERLRWEAQRKHEEEKDLRRREFEAFQRKQAEENERRLRKAEEAAARLKWKLYHESKTLDEISEMEGRQFEEFLQRLFLRMGYTGVSLTPTNDQGADLHLCLTERRSRCCPSEAMDWHGRQRRCATSAGGDPIL
jgi:hypothetical protein